MISSEGKKSNANMLECQTRRISYTINTYPNQQPTKNKKQTERQKDRLVKTNRKMNEIQLNPKPN